MKQQIQELFAGIVKTMGVDNAVIVVTSPENPQHGDYTTNIAMLLAGRLKAPPMKIAQDILDMIKKDQRNALIQSFEKVEIASPGFINITMSEAALGNQLARVLTEKDRYGATRYTIVTSDSGKKEGNNVGKTAETKALKKSGASVDAKNVQKIKKHQNKEQIAAEKGEREEKKEFGNTAKESVRTIMVEYAHPNTHKAFHIGHLRNITTGESVVRLLEAVGHRVIRVNYQGDVGMHIAKALYALLEVSPFKDQVHSMKGIKNRVEFLGKAYATGSKAFEEDEVAKQHIVELNALIYASAQRYAKEVGRNPGTTDYLALVKNQKYPLEAIYDLWKETRQWSLDYFEEIYQRVYTHYDRYYFESECLEGVDLAKDAVKTGVLKESEGAIIFEGKPYGLDTRVFVNSLGLPTYEAKELALAGMESVEYGDLTRLIHCVGPEQASFFKVTFKAEELLGIIRPGVQHHLAYGWVKLKEGKMSSRLGNVVLGEWLIDEVKKEIYTILDKSVSKYDKKDQDMVAETVAMAAIKYSFLKVSTPSEIAFDFKESMNTSGDSGPYLQYTYARCVSVLAKAQYSYADAVDVVGLSPDERGVLRSVMQFQDIVKAAADNFAPNTLCTYLFDLAQQFNLMYSKDPIVGNPRRLAVTAAAAQVIKNGLYLLGINVLERM